MQTQVDQWAADDDTRTVFLNCYLLMTRGMLLALERGEFQDPVWVSRLLERFADYYFEALAAYDQRLSHTPLVWRITHDAACANACLPLQNLMLGVNAHISYDLVLALVELLEAEWPRLSSEAQAMRYQDHCHVNTVIGRTIETVQDEVIAQLTPAFALVDSVLGSLDEWVTTRMIATWRDTVWRYAAALLACRSDQAREELRCEIETLTLQRAERILLDDTLRTHIQHSA